MTRAFVDYLIPWGDGPAKAVVLPPEASELIWRLCGRDLRRAQVQAPDTDLAVAIYALSSAAALHNARGQRPASGTSDRPDAGRLPLSSRTEGSPSELSTTEVADLLDADPSLVRRFAREGKLPARKVGRDWLFARLDAEGFRRKWRT